MRQSMIEFQKITKEQLIERASYFTEQTTHISDFSLGFLFMWGEHLQAEFALVENCLVLKEEFEGETYFHYPLSRSGEWEGEVRAIERLETFCRDGDFRLHFTNVPKEKLPLLVYRYGENVRIANPRRWRDYLYRVEDFQRYAGGKYSGQRNHVNKFRKNYPEWRFREYEATDEKLVRDFFAKYGEIQRKKHSALAEEELDKANELLSFVSSFGLRCGLLFVGEKLVAFTAGERCGDTMVVHIEKALREYEGAYPFVAQQFALSFCTDVQYLNRMDDAGDSGLRKSKLQYLPCGLVDKYTLTPLRAIDLIEMEPTVQTERLTLAPITDEYTEAYARLASNVERNRYWGYDYREAYQGEDAPPSEWFLGCIREDFAQKNEISLGIYLSDKLIGEAVLHRFGYRQDAEVGARLLPEFEGRGYAREAIRALAEYALIELDIERIEAKCYRQNERSKRMLLSAGFRPSGESETHYYFYKTSSV